MVSFHDKLLSISIGGSIDVYSTSSHDQCWLHIQNMNEEYYRGLGKERVGDVRGGWALPTGELVVLGSRRIPAKDGLPACTKMAVFKAPLTGNAYHVINPLGCSKGRIVHSTTYWNEKRC